MAPDSYYTPSSLASRLIQHINERKINTVADFCVGDGELLRAAAARWPKIKCFGIDISNKAVSNVKLLHPTWNLNKCNFLSKESRQRSIILKKVQEFDLILLNPPFSCIGGSRYKVELDGLFFDVSTAMVFLVESIKYLSKKGSIYAILPNSVAYSQKDRMIWKYLIENYKLAVLEESTEKHFADCSPSIILVSINAQSKACTLKELKSLTINKNGVTIFRGKIGMHKVTQVHANGKFLVHSTNLRNNKIENTKHRVKHILSEVTGPAVLIPRVGLPNPKKICIVSRNNTYALSDCVIAIKTKTQKDSTELKRLFLENWAEIISLYKGTGARYVTVERLKLFLGLKNLN